MFLQTFLLKTFEQVEPGKRKEASNYCQFCEGNSMNNREMPVIAQQGEVVARALKDELSTTSTNAPMVSAKVLSELSPM
uniref:Uncharacterized protein n=1 Tax=Picea sitchensis TaxID=3332 RepID=D5ABZ9_PICSI|nr:unknown [Picea sitchensis]